MARRPNNWPRYLVWRDGRPRWVPSPKLRAAGLQGRDLKDAAGNWLPKGAAIDAAEAINASLDMDSLRPVRAGVLRAAPRTLDTLAQRYFASRHFRFRKRSDMEKAPETQRIYRQAVAALPAYILAMSPADLTPPVLEALYETLLARRGVHRAYQIFAVLSEVLKHGVRTGWLKANPAREIERQTPPGRLRLIEPAEAEALLAAADAAGLPWVGDALVLGLNTAQRIGDILALPYTLVDETHVRLSQLKSRGRKRIDAPLTDAARRRLSAIRARRRALKVVPAAIIFDGSGRPLNRRTFNHQWRAVCEIAAQRVETCAGIKFHDTRDTAVTRLASAPGNSMANICAVTGHSAASVEMIVKHYLVLTAGMAAEGIGNLNAFMEREGIAV